MRNRNIPYGYGYTNGKIVLQSAESVVVEKIFQAYLCGQSLRVIAENLNDKKVEYSESVVDWNEARLKRIIEDDRYIGRDRFPPIVEDHIYEAAQELKQEKRIGGVLADNAEIIKIKRHVKCTDCHGKMCRKRDNRLKNQIKWFCENQNCRTVVAKEDEDFIRELTEIMNLLIKEPGRIKNPVESEVFSDEKSLENRNEITRMLNNANIDIAEVRKEILESVSRAYENLDVSISATQKLKDIFERVAPSENYPSELFHRTVKEIVLGKDGGTEIVLKNNQIIRKER